MSTPGAMPRLAVKCLKRGAKGKASPRSRPTHPRPHLDVEVKLRLGHAPDELDEVVGFGRHRGFVGFL